MFCALFTGLCIVLQFHRLSTLPPLTKLFHCPRQWQWALLVRCFIIVLMHGLDTVCMLCLYLWYKYLDGWASLLLVHGWRVVLWCDLILDDLLCHDTSILVQVNRFLMTLGTGSLKKWMQHLLYIPLNTRAWFLMVIYSKSQLLVVGQSKMRSYMNTWREHVPRILWRHSVTKSLRCKVTLEWKLLGRTYWASLKVRVLPMRVSLDLCICMGLSVRSHDPTPRAQVWVIWSDRLIQFTVLQARSS